MGSVRRFGRDVLAGFVTIGLVVATTVLASRAFIPATPTETTAASTETSVAMDPVAEVAALPDPAALIYASGAIEGRFLLGVVPSRPFGTPPNASSNDIEIQYRGSEAQLTVGAKAITVGEARTDRITVVVVLNGQSFIAHDGDCTLLISQFEYLQPTDGTSRLIASFIGELECRELANVHGGDAVSFTAAFDR